MTVTVVKVWRFVWHGLMIMGASVMTMQGYNLFMTDDLRYETWLYEHRPQA